MKFSEDQLISLLCRAWPRKHPLLRIGPGDDCALLQGSNQKYLEVFKVDSMVQDVHFTLNMPPRQVGYKALARVISDFAAMGARPMAALVALALPVSANPQYLLGCYQGMGQLARTYSIALAGGELTRAKELSFHVSAVGKVSAKTYVLRSTASVGDLIFVTGKLGGSFPLRHLTFTPRLKEGQWLAQHRFASAMIDLSDGLGKDLPRLARASKVSFELDQKKIPLQRSCSLNQAVNDGEDYEILFTVSPKKVKRLLKKWPFRTPLTCIGEIISPTKAPRVGNLKMQGFDHLIRD